MSTGEDSPSTTVTSDRGSVSQMRAIITRAAGGPEVLSEGDVGAPQPAADEVLLRTTAVGVNRADLLQRQGFYPPPPGTSAILGLECSGVVAEVGTSVRNWLPGTPVCALLTGGGYAELVAVPECQVMPIPAGVAITDAAGLPEVACTVYSNLAMTAGLTRGEWLLLHGGASGIGTFAIQWAKAIGARVAVTAGSDERAQRCLQLGADAAFNYRSTDFVDAVKSVTAGRGADVILDIVGAKYLEANVKALAHNGRLMVIGLQGGTKGTLDLGRLLGKAGTIRATSLRSRPIEEKGEICRRVVTEVWPLIEQGSIKVVVDRVLPLTDAGEAHRIVAAGENFGKVLLRT